MQSSQKNHRLDILLTFYLLGSWSNFPRLLLQQSVGSEYTVMEEADDLQQKSFATVLSLE